MGVSASAIFEAIFGTVAEAGAGTAVAEGAAAAGTAAGTAAAGTSLGTAAAYGAGTAVAGALAAKLLAPKIPGQKSPTPLPDQSAIDQAKRRSLLLQRQRAGRDSTILSQGDSDTLG